MHHTKQVTQNALAFSSVKKVQNAAPPDAHADAHFLDFKTSAYPCNP